MKRKVVSFIICMLMSLNLVSSAMATNVDVETINYGDGYTLVITTTEHKNDSNARTVMQKYIEREAKAYHGNTYIGKFTLCGTFVYDGRKSASTDDDWYASSSYGYSASSSHSGAKVSGTCTFNYAGGKTYSLTMTCDKNGNISYS